MAKRTPPPLSPNSDVDKIAQGLRAIGITMDSLPQEDVISTGRVNKKPVKPATSRGRVPRTGVMTTPSPGMEPMIDLEGGITPPAKPDQPSRPAPVKTTSDVTASFGTSTGEATAVTLLQKQVAELESSLKVMTNQYAGAVKEKDTALAELKQAQSSHDAFEDTANALTRDRDTAREEISSLKGELDKKRTELDTLKNHVRVGENNETDAELVNLREAATIHASDLAAMTRERDTALARIETLEQENKRLRDELDTVQSEADSLRHELAETQTSGVFVAQADETHVTGTGSRSLISPLVAAGLGVGAAGAGVDLEANRDIDRESSGDIDGNEYVTGEQGDNPFSQGVNAEHVDAYSSTPAYTFPVATDTPKRHHKLLIILLTIFVILALAFTWWWFMGRNPKTNNNPQGSWVTIPTTSTHPTQSPTLAPDGLVVAPDGKTISGSNAPAGGTVKITDTSGKLLGQGKADSAGNWSVPLTSPVTAGQVVNLIMTTTTGGITSHTIILPARTTPTPTLSHTQTSTPPPAPARTQPLAQSPPKTSTHPPAPPANNPRPPAASGSVVSIHPGSIVASTVRTQLSAIVVTNGATNISATFTYDGRTTPISCPTAPSAGTYTCSGTGPGMAIGSHSFTLTVNGQSVSSIITVKGT